MRRWQFKLQKMGQRLNRSPVWMGLAIVQLLMLLALWFTWPITLSLVVPLPEQAMWNRLIQEFQRQSNIRIQLISGDYTTDQLEAIYTAELKSNQPTYDFIYTDIIWTPKLAAAGWLKDLSELITLQDLEKFSALDVAAGRYQESLYRIPFRLDAGVLYYNTELLPDRNQLPQTFEQLIAISQQAQQQGLADWGYLWQGQRYEGLAAVFLEVLAGYGGFWIDSNTGAVGLDRPESIAAARFLQQALNTISPLAVTTYTEDETLAAFKQGNTVFLRSWPYHWALLNAKDSPLLGKVGVAPVVHAIGQQSTASRGGWGFSIAQNAKHPRAAWRAIEFFTSESAQRKLLEWGYLPSLRSLYTDPEILQRFPQLPVFQTSLETAILRPPIPQYDLASRILQRHLSAIFSQPLVPERQRNIVETEMRAAAIETRNLMAIN